MKAESWFQLRIVGVTITEPNARPEVSLRCHAWFDEAVLGVIPSSRSHGPCHPSTAQSGVYDELDAPRKLDMKLTAAMDALAN